jgi:hypothetical protein
MQLVTRKTSYLKAGFSWPFSITSRASAVLFWHRCPMIRSSHMLNWRTSFGNRNLFTALFPSLLALVSCLLVLVT